MALVSQCRTGPVVDVNKMLKTLTNRHGDHILPQVVRDACSTR